MGAHLINQSRRKILDDARSSRRAGRRCGPRVLSTEALLNEHEMLINEVIQQNMREIHPRLYRALSGR